MNSFLCSLAVWIYGHVAFRASSAVGYDGKCREVMCPPLPSQALSSLPCACRAAQRRVGGGGDVEAIGRPAPASQPALPQCQRPSQSALSTPKWALRDATAGERGTPTGIPGVRRGTFWDGEPHTWWPQSFLKSEGTSSYSCVCLRHGAPRVCYINKNPKKMT